MSFESNSVSIGLAIPSQATTAARLILATDKKYGPVTGKKGVVHLSKETLKGFVKIAGYLLYLTLPIPEDVYYILFLSIASHVRGRGLGKFPEALEVAEALGFIEYVSRASADKLRVAPENRLMAVMRTGSENLYNTESNLCPVC